MKLLQTLLRFTKSQKSDRKAAPEQPVQGSAHEEKTFHVSVIACIPDGRKLSHVQKKIVHFRLQENKKKNLVALASFTPDVRKSHEFLVTQQDGLVFL